MKTREIYLTIGLVLVSVIALTQHQTKSSIQFQVAEQRELIEKQHALIDSLHGELFISNSTIGRWELSLDYLNQVEPEAVVKFSRFYDHETE
jgi:hypothetical protein